MSAYMLSCKYKVVIDTNIIVSALMGTNVDTACRAVLRLAFEDKVKPMVGNALYCEYEDVIGRDDIYMSSPLDLNARNQFLDDFLSLAT